MTTFRDDDAKGDEASRATARRDADAAPDRRGFSRPASAVRLQSFRVNHPASIVLLNHPRASDGAARRWSRRSRTPADRAA
ncbi:MAG TPA: hypothetical protein RMG45_03020, partial [Polyangiaceae bacterium LLY-WYZ-15_(1-7)]|nr:hypothetical protein [Polyangiaceae bacterium LLY-WYZ-15_(1-7)]